MLPVVAIIVAVPKLPVLALPVAFKVPVTLTPVPVTATMFALPAALILTLPLIDGILILLVPFASGPIKLPLVILPVTANDANVPTLVMFG